MPGHIQRLLNEERGARAKRVALVFAAVLAIVWIGDGIIDAWLEPGMSFHDSIDHPRLVEVWIRLLWAALFTALYEARRVSSRLRLLSAALEAAPDGVQITDLRGQVAYSNHAVEEVYGFSPDELRGRHVNDMNVDPAFATRVVLPALQREGRWAGELEVKHKDGHAFPIWLRTSLVRNARGRPLAAVGVIRDITERKRAEEELRRYAHRLEEATRLKELFSDILRHDLLGPASALQMSIATLMKHEVPPSCARLLTGARRSCGRLTDMIEGAATYAKLSSVQQLEFGTVDLADTLRNVAADHEVALGERGARLVLELPGPCPARANPVVSEVFTNLVSNAIKYGPEGGVITAGVADAGDEWRTSVADRGEGIRDEDKERIFTRFERAAKGGVKGTGLGLAIARRVVELHGGRIWVENRPGGGSVFVVTLPKAEAAAAASAPAPG